MSALANRLMRRFRVSTFAGLLWVASLGTLTSGCFGIVGRLASKPVQTQDRVKFDSREGYHRYVPSPEFDLDVSIDNLSERWGVWFLFWILPFPIIDEPSMEGPLWVDLTVQPKQEISFDPWHTFYLGTNQFAIAPSKVNGKTNISGVFPITTNTTFHLVFNVPAAAEVPFVLSVEGFSHADQPLSVPLMRFETATVVGPEFRLPY